MFKIASKIIYNSYLAYLWTRTRFHKRSDRDRDQIRSCDPDRPIAFHKSDHDRLIRSRNTKPNSLLPIQSWHKSFTGKYRTEMTWSWLNKNHQTGDIYSWHHNGGVATSFMSADTRGSWPVQCTHTEFGHNTTRFGHAIFDRYVYVIDVIENMQTVDTRLTMFQ